jgi:hypothetical protein
LVVLEMILVSLISYHIDYHFGIHILYFGNAYFVTVSFPNIFSVFLFVRDSNYRRAVFPNFIQFGNLCCESSSKNKVKLSISKNGPLVLSYVMFFFTCPSFIVHAKKTETKNRKDATSMV